jgi:serine/threonine protein kinase/tetratricopeptide (TPR) repeat protein
VDGHLGRGAAGVVYRARHASTGQIVALKAARLTSAELFAAFRREVHALAALQHPGIVRVLEQGISNGTPWYAMELVEGRTLSSMLGDPSVSTAAPVGREGSRRLEEFGPEGGRASRRLEESRPRRTRGSLDPQPASSHRSGSRRSPAAPSEALSMSSLLRLARHVCSSLACLHAQGLVHRDIKPDNILIRPDGNPILVDFGLVAQCGAREGREVLELSEAAAGTYAYMAPEQRLGRFVDARADLFSLGCVLYQCLCGALPFGPSGLQALSCAIPAPPSSRATGIPPELDALVMRLLAKDLRERIGYADDVEAALARIEGTDVSRAGVLGSRTLGESGPERERGSRTLEESGPERERGSYLYRPEFAGREDALQRLERLLADALCGHGGCALVSGESGAGKTRLVLELAARAAEKGMTVITGECFPAGIGAQDRGALGAPLQPFRGFLLAVADACRAGGAATTELLLADRAEVLAPYEPVLATLPGAGVAGAPEPLPPEAARTRLLTALRALLFDFARHSPLLFVIDDLQWADQLSLELLATLTPEECARTSLAVVGTYRVEEMSDGLRELAARPGSTSVQVGRLDRDAVHRMVGGMLALHAPPDELVDFVHRESSGNPFIIAEYLRTAIEERLLRRDSEGRWALASARAPADMRDRIGPPATITALIERRLHGLDALSTDVAHAAAVLGRDFDVDLVARTMGIDAAAVLDAYGSLRRRQILEEDAAGSSRFVHDKLREAVYARIGGPRAAELHLRAADALEHRHSGGDRDPHLGTLAYHLAGGGAHARAAEYYERAGDHARRRYANRDAIRFYRCALQEIERAGGMDAGESWPRLEESIGELLLVVGEPELARAALSESIRATDTSAPCWVRARRRRRLAQTWERQHRHADALDAYALAEQDLGPSDEGAGTEYWHEYVQIQVDKVWDLYFLAKVDELGALVERVRPLVGRHASRAQLARFFQALVQNESKRDRFRIAPETLDHARRALEAAERCDDLRELSTARFTLGFVLMMRGSDAEAEPLLRGALAGSEKLGDAPLEARFLSYYTVVQRRLGRQTETRTCAERSLALAERGRMLDYVGVAHANLAWCTWWEGRRTDAEAHAREALAVWEKLRPAYIYPLEWLARIPLAACLYDRQRGDEALEQLGLVLENPQYLLPDPLAGAIRARRADPEDGAGPPSVPLILEMMRTYRYL